jgi:hypothetical protein
MGAEVASGKRRSASGVTSRLELSRYAAVWVLAASGAV